MNKVVEFQSVLSKINMLIGFLLTCKTVWTSNGEIGNVSTCLIVLPFCENSRHRNNSKDTFELIPKLNKIF